MRNQVYEHLNFKQAPLISRRTLLHAGALIALRVLWGALDPVAFFWVMMIVVSLLLWMAAAGWKSALRDLYHWLGQVSTEI